MREQSLVSGNWFVLTVLCAAAALGCGRGVQGLGGETNFLGTCVDDCENGFECIEGVCTVACEDDSACEDLPGEATCSGNDSTSCDVECERDADCRDVSADHECVEGACRRLDENGPTVGGNGGGSSGGAGAGNEAGGNEAGNVEPGAAGLNAIDLTQRVVDKVDLLFMIDNSISMADKQGVLSLAVPVLVQRLVNPVCIDAQGNASETGGPEEDCPPGAAREFPPLRDIHVGIVTSSMGDAGANLPCAYVDTDPDSVQKVDDGYLLGSLQRGGQSEPGFLSWTGAEGAAFGDSFRDQVRAAGEFGCGYESQLEAWYHFLIDPTPWMSIETIDCAGQAAGSGNCRRPNIPMNDDGTFGDPFILRQRSLFLRPDSLVAIVMVTDENDCSIIAGGPFNAVAQTNVQMFRGSDQCATDSNDACCYSCGTATPSGCTDGCTEATGGRYVPLEDDEPNLRCFEQKRRFGLDFLYPTQRYVNALTKAELGACRVDLDPTQCDPSENAPNPLFAGGRNPSLVLFAGIVGVPWQLIQSQTDEDGNDYPAGELHFLTNAQLQGTPTSTSPWNPILGPVSARDAHMIESIASAQVAGRPGLPTITTGAGSDEIHGHEWQSESADDLQYACISPLPEGRDCDGADFSNGKRGCECRGAGDAAYTEGNPLCYSNGAYSSVQVFAKAYPGLRELEALRAFGDVTGNAVVGSICARNVQGDTLAQDFGYNPTVSALVDRMEKKLGGRCLTAPLPVDDSGIPACSIVEVSQESDGGCECDGEARWPLDAATRSAAVAELAARGACQGEECGEACFCGVLPAGGSATGGEVSVADRNTYGACQTEDAPSVDGWCYVDENVPVVTGGEVAEADKNALVQACESGNKRILRFVGEASVANGALVVAVCKP